MFPSGKLWTVLTLIVSVVAFSSDKRTSGSVLVGYRVVAKSQADGYKNAGNTLVWTNDQLTGGSSEQLGPGVYISPKIGDWFGNEDSWYCVIFADNDAWNLVNKAWIAASNGCKPLWWPAGAPNRPEELTELGGSTFTPSNTVLLSKIDGYEKLQLLIPPQLLGSADALSLNVRCAAKSDTNGIAGLSANGDVDWSGWLNVKGVVQTMSPPADD